MFPKIGVSQFIMENPIKMDDLGVTTIFGNIHLVQESHVFFLKFCFFLELNCGCNHMWIGPIAGGSSIPIFQPIP